MKRLAKLLATSAIAGGALFQLAAPSNAAPSNAAAPPRPLPQGVDVSTYDRGVDWGGGRLAFGIAKATRGPGTMTRPSPRTGRRSARTAWSAAPTTTGTRRTPPCGRPTTSCRR